ncbi:MAG: hypothetical protein H6603_03370 [Flavobacteriales bacterium]|nr:hypothetical protein [Flavobacteriales bacterium]MCB9203997.1 hypothetical protein [Flavobacteriales bacterium]
MDKGIYRFLYKRDKPMSMKIMGIIAALFSLGGLACTPLLGIALALGAAGLLIYQNGIEVNFKDRSYRLITAFGPQGFGEWEPLPPLKCVSVFKTQLVSSTYGRSNASITTRQEVIQVNLATEQNKRIRLLETENVEEAFAFAKEAAQKLNVQLWDAATSKEGKWLAVS